MMSARTNYREWHKAVYGGDQSYENLLPVSKEKLKCFLVDLHKAGFAPNTIIFSVLTGICSWVMYL